MKDYYKILGVSENSTADDIKKQFRSLSKQYHPDVNPEGADKFKEINEAYEVLGNPQKRKEFDERKNNPYVNTQFEDIFQSMFGGGSFFQKPRKNAPDKMVKVQISPIESYLGSEKNITYFKNNHCNNCNGSGGEQQRCKTCNGVGFQIRVFGTGFMTQQVRAMCNDCGGRGFTLVHRCYVCGGKGTQSASTEVKVKLPHGIDSGQFLKLESFGDFINGEYGDLVIQVEVVSKDGFEKINNDLVYTKFLNLEEIQQENYIVPHPDGELKLQAPRTFDTSKPLRVRGKGYNGGDMYLKLNVKFDRVI